MTPNTLRGGTTSKLVMVYARDADEPTRAKVGLSASSPSAGAAFVREGATEATPIPLRPGTLGQHDPGGFVEVDRSLLPGVYQFGVPDAMLAEGSTRAIVILRFPGAAIDPVVFDLVAYDPQDPVRIGVSSLANEKRHEFLRRALPRLTEMELALGEDAERRLRDRPAPAAGT